MGFRRHIVQVEGRWGDSQPYLIHKSIPEIRFVEMEVLVLYGNDSNPAGSSFYTATVHLFLKASWQFCTERLGSILSFSRFFFFLCSLINSNWLHWISPAESFDSPSIACTKGDVILMDAVYCNTEKEHRFRNHRPLSHDGKTSRFLSWSLGESFPWGLR